MNGWTLEQVRGLSAEDYDELCAWLRDQAESARGEESVDMDALIRARFGTTEDE